VQRWLAEPPGKAARMNGPRTTAKDLNAITVVLEGGPADIPADLRLCRAEAGAVRIKLEHCGGYEHFERIENGADPVVFRWSMRTRMAE
jgi:hypothetical protein